MMTYEVQMSWLEARISTLKYKDRTNSEEQDLEALLAIRQGYKNAKDDSVALSWVNAPDRMGR